MINPLNYIWPFSTIRKLKLRNAALEGSNQALRDILNEMCPYWEYSQIEKFFVESPRSQFVISGIEIPR